jgi:hypothetical protein
MKRILLSAALVAVCVIALAGIPAAMAQSGNTWRADYFPNTDWAGSPVMTTQFNSLLSFNWGYGSPSSAVPADNFTARFTTDAFFYAGNYQFSVVADDEVVLIIDGITRLDTRGQGASGKSFVMTFPMWQGTHRVEVLYREFTQSAYVHLNWVFLGGGQPPPPPPPGTPSPYPPLPPSASSVQTRYGDYTPCIQQNIHQSNCFVSDGAWDSPNLGSIQMEPQIASWNNCVADQVQTFVDPNLVERSYACSKTEAGWFPR